MAENPQKTGAAIRRVRSLRSMSQAELAKEADLTPNFLCQLEAGSKRCSHEVLTRIANVLGVPPTLLLVIAEDAPQSTRPNVKEAHKELQDLAWDLLERTLPKLDRKL